MNKINVKNKNISIFTLFLIILTSLSLSSCANSDTSKKIVKLPDSINISVNFVLPDYIYNSKDEIFNDFFAEFYNYILSKDGGAYYLQKNNINSLDDLYKMCKSWDDKSSTGLPKVGNILSKYYLFQRVGSNFVEQSHFDYFIGYCINNNKFVDFIYFLRDFFYHFRMDEGYTGEKSAGKDPNGSDFFASSYASIIDTAKFFYYTKETLPDYFISKKNIPNLYDKIPGLLKNNFNSSMTISYDTKSDLGFALPNDFNCYGFHFLGFYTDDILSSDCVSYINNDFIIKNNIISNNNSITLYAKFRRAGKYADELINDFPHINQ